MQVASVHINPIHPKGNNLTLYKKKQLREAETCTCTKVQHLVLKPPYIIPYACGYSLASYTDTIECIGLNLGNEAGGL